MKKIVAVVFCAALLLGGCAEVKLSDVTPTLDAIETIYIQRTNIDENGEYTYFEKIITDADKIEAFCKKVDKLKFVKIDPVEFNSVDYLIFYEGKKNHKILFSGDQIIYDGKANKIYKGNLTEQISKLYNELPDTETPAVSKIFQK